MQIFKLIEKVFFLGLTILSNFTNALDFISMKNRECKLKSEIINVTSNNPMFYPFSVKINVVAIVIILMIHMQEFVFLML